MILKQVKVHLFPGVAEAKRSGESCDYQKDDIKDEQSAKAASQDSVHGSWLDNEPKFSFNHLKRHKG